MKRFVWLLKRKSISISISVRFNEAVKNSQQPNGRVYSIVEELEAVKGKINRFLDPSFNPHESYLKICKTIIDEIKKQSEKVAPLLNKADEQVKTLKNEVSGIGDSKDAEEKLVEALAKLQQGQEKKQQFITQATFLQEKASAVVKTLQTIMKLSQLQSESQKFWKIIDERWEVSRTQELSVVKLDEFFSNQERALQEHITSLQVLLTAQQNIEEDDKEITAETNLENVIAATNEADNLLNDINEKFLKPLKDSYYVNFFPLQEDLREYWRLIDEVLRIDAEHSVLDKDPLKFFDEKVRGDMSELFTLFNLLPNAGKEREKTIEEISKKIETFNVRRKDINDKFLTPLKEFCPKLNILQQGWGEVRQNLQEQCQLIDERLRIDADHPVLLKDTLEFLDEEMQKDMTELSNLFNSLQNSEAKEREKSIKKISKKIAQIETRLKDLNGTFLTPLKRFNEVFVESVLSRKSYGEACDHLSSLWMKARECDVLAAGIKQIETPTQRSQFPNRQQNIEAVPVPKLLKDLKSIERRYPKYIENIETLMREQFVWLKSPLDKRKTSTPPLVMPTFVELRTCQTKTVDSSEEQTILQLKSEIYLSHIVSSQVPKTLNGGYDEKANMPEHPFVEVCCYLSKMVEYLISAVVKTTQEPVLCHSSLAQLEQKLKELQPVELMEKLKEFQQQIKKLVIIKYSKMSLQRSHERYVRMFNGQEDDSIPVLSLPTKEQLETLESIDQVIKSLDEQIKEMANLLLKAEKERESEDLSKLSSKVEGQLNNLEQEVQSCTEKLTFLAGHNPGSAEVTVNGLRESVTLLKTNFKHQLKFSAKSKKIELERLDKAISNKQQQLASVESGFSTVLANVNRLIKKNNAAVDRLVKFDPDSYKKTESTATPEEYKENDDSRFKSFRTSSTLAEDVEMQRLVAESKNQETLETKLGEELIRIQQDIKAVNEDVKKINTDMEKKKAELCEEFSTQAWSAIEKEHKCEEVLPTLLVNVDSVTRRELLEIKDECARRQRLSLPNCILIASIRQKKTEICQQFSDDAWKVIETELMNLPFFSKNRICLIDDVLAMKKGPSMTHVESLIIKKFLKQTIPNHIKHLKVINRAKQLIADIRKTWSALEQPEMAFVLTEAEKIWKNALSLIGDMNFSLKVRESISALTASKQTAESIAIESLVVRETKRILEHISIFLAVPYDENALEGKLQGWLVNLLTVEKNRHVSLTGNINSVITDIAKKHCNATNADGLSQMKGYQHKLNQSLIALDLKSFSDNPTSDSFTDDKRMNETDSDVKVIGDGSSPAVAKMIHKLVEFRCANYLARKTSDNLCKVAEGKTSSWLKWFRALIDYYHYWRNGKTETYSSCSRLVLYGKGRQTILDSIKMDETILNNQQERDCKL
jgi:acylphosphatase